MTVPDAIRTAGGAWDCLIDNGGNVMGFITRGPAARRQVSNTAPRIRIGSDAGYAEGAFDQLILYGFQHGQDLRLQGQDDRRAQSSDGGIAHYMDDRITLASKWTDTDTPGTAPTYARIIDFETSNGKYICIAMEANLRAYRDATGIWGNQTPAAGFGGSLKHIFANDQYLFASIGTQGAFWRWDGQFGGGWAQPAAGVSADAFGWYQDTLYRVLGRQIIPATANDGTAWGTAVDVGWPTTNISDLWESSGYLFMAKPEGLYLYDGTTVYQMVDATETRALKNFAGGTWYQGAMYVPWLNAIHKMVVQNVRSSTVSDITPTLTGSAGKERYGHGTPRVIFKSARHMYVALDDGEGLYPELLMYNGIGFHQVFRGEAGRTMYAAGYSRLKGWLLINDGTTRYKRVVNTGVGEYADYSGYGELVTPKIDGGYPDELKAFRSITIDAKDVDVVRTIVVSYRADDGTWQPVGTITTEGKNELVLDNANGQVSARAMEFRFALNTDDPAVTPRIELPIVVRLLVRPTAVDAMSVTLTVDENQLLRNGKGNVKDSAGYTEAQMLQFLDDCADTTNTLIYTDEWGRRFRVAITDKVESETRDPGQSDRSMQVALTMMEMFSGKSVAESYSGSISGSVTTAFQTTDYLTDASGAALLDASGTVLEQAA